MKTQCVAEGQHWHQLGGCPLYGMLKIRGDARGVRDPEHKAQGSSRQSKKETSFRASKYSYTNEWVKGDENALTCRKYSRVLFHVSTELLQRLGASQRASLFPHLFPSTSCLSGPAHSWHLNKPSQLTKLAETWRSQEFVSFLICLFGNHWESTACNQEMRM